MELDVVAYFVTTYWIPALLAIGWLAVRRRRVHSWFSFLWQQVLFAPILFNYFLLLYWVDTTFAKIYSSNGVGVLCVMYCVILMALLALSGLYWLILHGVKRLSRSGTQ